MKWLQSNFFAIFLFIGIMAIMLYGFEDAARSSEEEQFRMVEESLRRAVVSCYAIEGRYPGNLQYIYDQYGIQVDEEKYIVHYEIFAANIMPEITVLER